MNKVGILPIGRIIGAHGIRGEIKVYPYGDLSDFKWTSVYIAGKEKRLLKVKRARSHKGTVIFELEGVTTRNDAEALAGLELAVAAEELPGLPQGEYYHAELEGMEVVADDGRALGRVTNIISTGGNDVLEVHGPLGEVLIPAAGQTVKEVDRKKRVITVHLLEGLLPSDEV